MGPRGGFLVQFARRSQSFATGNLAVFSGTDIMANHRHGGRRRKLERAPDSGLKRTHSVSQTTSKPHPGICGCPDDKPRRMLPNLDRPIAGQNLATCEWADETAHFLSRAFNAVQGTFGTTGARPSTALRFAVCISELTPTTSKMPASRELPTRSPRFGAITLGSAIPHLPG